LANPKRRAFRGRILGGILAVAGFVVRRLPLSIVQRAGSLLGSFGSLVVRRERRRAIENVARAFPDWSAAQRKRLVRASFQHIGKSVLELLWLPNLDTRLNETTLYEGTERLLALIDAGRPVIIFTAHCGNWEWLCYGSGKLGRPTAVLQRERNEVEMNQFITDMRTRAGVQTIDRGSAGSARELLQATKRGGILAFLIDQSLRTESVKVPFFGVPAPTPIGPAKLAIRSEAIAMPGFVERLNDGRHLIRFGDPIECKRGDDPIALTTRMTEEIEAQIRRVPEQWVWFHDRWRERPKWDVTPPE
jgi:KDO2-lipid IV(A) lauroyltransferase